MKLKPAFYKKFYDKLYRTIYLREYNKEPIIKNEKYGSKVWTEKISVLGQKEEIFRERYYFEARSKYFYDRFADAKEGKDIQIDNLPYFKALLYIGFKTKLDDRLDFLTLFKINTQRKINEQDKFLKYCDENLQFLHYTFARDWFEDHADETIFLTEKPQKNANKNTSILDILKEDVSEFHKYRVNNLEKDILYECIFNISKFPEDRIKALLYFSVNRYLSVPEIINLFRHPEMQVISLMSTLFIKLIPDDCQFEELEEIITILSRLEGRHLSSEFLNGEVSKSRSSIISAASKSFLNIYPHVTFDMINFMLKSKGSTDEEYIDAYTHLFRLFAHNSMDEFDLEDESFDYFLEWLEETILTLSNKFKYELAMTPLIRLFRKKHSYVFEKLKKTLESIAVENWAEILAEPIDDHFDDYDHLADYEPVD